MAVTLFGVAAFFVFRHINYVPIGYRSLEGTFMDREPYFKELCIALAREGFTLQSEQDGLLPVNWNNLPLCRVTDAGGIRYWQENVAAPDQEQALGRATHLAGMVREYMTLLKISAKGLWTPM